MEMLSRDPAAFLKAVKFLFFVKNGWICFFGVILSMTSARLIEVAKEYLPRLPGSQTVKRLEEKLSFSFVNFFQKDIFPQPKKQKTP